MLNMERCAHAVATSRPAKGPQMVPPSAAERFKKTDPESQSQFIWSYIKLMALMLIDAMIKITLSYGIPYVESPWMVSTRVHAFRITLTGEVGLAPIDIPPFTKSQLCPQKMLMSKFN